MAILDRSFPVLTTLVIFASFFSRAELKLANSIPDSFNRSSFPHDFVFGAASSSYQYEGAAKEGGKGQSIWDTFAHQHPEKIADRSTGDVTIDFYHRYKEDISMIKDVGMDAFRLSISWPRILPRGKVSEGVNREGINFYNHVFDELIAKGIKPFVTLFHWELPQTLEDEYGGFLNISIVNDYRDYVDLCFKEFGDRVKHWITLNEPFIFTQMGYELGTLAPGRCSKYAGNCTEGNSATEPYIVVHNQLLCHAAAVKVYREKYQISQKGEIGISLASQWYEPKTRSVADLAASYRILDFQMGWLMHPITYGDYPPIMRSYVGNRLPKFTKKQSKMLRGSKDFVGFNYYTANYASHSQSVNTVNLSMTSDSRADISFDKNGIPICEPQSKILNGSKDFVGFNYYTSNYASHNQSVNTVNLSLTSDSRADISFYKNGIPICEPTALFWLFNCPNGIRDLMLYIKKKYKDPAMYITENGMADANNSTLSIQEALMDNQRIRYYKGHLWYLQEAIKEGANVKGHFAWSFFDDFEWGSGYTIRFGINYVDYKDGVKRYPKRSALWYKTFLTKPSK